MLMCDKIPMIREPVRCVYTFFMPDKRARDLSNYLKVSEDLLVNRGIIPDDNTAHVKEVWIKFGGMDKQNPRVEIEVFPA